MNYEIAPPSDSATGREPRQHRLRTFVKVALTVVLLTVLVRIVGWRSLLEALQGARWPWLVSMWGTASITFAIIACNLWLLLRKLGLGIEYRRVLVASAVANFYSLIVPGDVVAGLSKWAVISAATRSSTASLSAIVLNKLVLALPPLLFGCLALFLQNPFPDLPIAGAAALCAISLLVLVLLGLWQRTGAWLDHGLLSLAHRLPGKLERSIGALVESARRVRQLGIGDFATIVLIAFASFATGITSFFCATRALALPVSVPTLLWISMALFLARLLPLTVNNLGVREGLLVLALAGENIAGAQAVGVGLLMFSNAIVIGLVGGLLQLAIAAGWLRLRVETPGAG